MTRVPEEMVVECADCGRFTARRSPAQRYCAPCSGKRDVARKREWAATHATASDPEKHARRKAQVDERGAELSIENRAPIAWPANVDPTPALRQVTRIAVPFDYAASKNAVWRHGRGGHVFAREEGKVMRAEIANRLRAQNLTWYQGKVWIDIYVEKPDHRGDAVNVVDLVCDAVKDAIGVDDRWYSIRRLDWSIVKVNPRLYVGVAQAVAEDHQACSACGTIRPFDAFTKNRSTKTGRARACRTCSSRIDKERRMAA